MVLAQLQGIKKGRPRKFTDEERKRRKNEQFRLRYQTDPAFRLSEQNRVKRYAKTSPKRQKTANEYSMVYYNLHKDDPAFLKKRRERTARYRELRRRRNK